MKTPRLSLMLGAFGLMMVAGGIQAADGEINFKGSVETSTCAISVGDTSGLSRPARWPRPGISPVAATFP
jgi:type 1 fimbria pilin